MAMVLPQPRTISERSRDAEFFDAAELERQTGQPRARFGSVALKELLDNGGDAAETAGRAPCLTLTVTHRSDELVTLAVQDNGLGMAPATVARILNFATRTSDKAAYKSPTRGAQGNALKTILGIPWALGCAEPLMITSQGVEHCIRAALDPSGDLLLTHTTRPVAPHAGTYVTLTVPQDALDRDPAYWGQAFALFNPHASVKICQGAEADLACSEPEGAVEHFYQATMAFPKPWRKYLPGDPTSAWWYSVDDLTRRIFSHISESRRGGPDFLLRDFVRKYFTNLSANAAAKAVCAAVPTITRLSDFASQEAAVATLHAAMRREGKPPSPATLGTIGADHFRHCFGVST
jgi:DNA topoisomerase VI subunit B